MAKIFPKELPSEIRLDPKRKAEVQIFDSLSAAKLPKDTNIYYSVAWLNKDIRSPRWDGECDFIIIDKDYGAIFIEVKGGVIRKEGASWYQNERKLKKSPLMQAKDSTYQVTANFNRRWQKNHYNERIPSFNYGWFAFFPHSSKNKNSEISMSEDIQQIGFSEDLENITKKIYDFFNYKPSESIGKKDELGLQGQNIFHDLIIGKNLDFSLPLDKQLKANSFEVKQLSKEQDKVISIIDQMKKIWIIGPAGSGKTTIALRTLAQYQDQPKSILFLCKNKLLSDSIKARYSQNNITVKTFDSYIIDLVKISKDESARKAALSSLGERGYTSEIQNILIDVAFDSINENKKKYDFIIVDESQDFKEHWWELISALMHEDSYLRIFGDMNQNLWGNKKPTIDGLQKTYLKEVFRNSQEIAKRTMLFCDQQGEDLSLKGPIMGDIILSDTSKEKGLKDIIKQLIKHEIIDPSDITILCRKKRLKALRNTVVAGIKISDDWSNRSKDIFATTVYHYKGMESHIVIMMIDDEWSLEELYIGMSRAITNLYIFAKEEKIKWIKQVLDIFD